MHTKIQTYRTLNGNSDFHAINIFLASHETRWEEERMENEKKCAIKLFAAMKRCLNISLLL